MGKILTQGPFQGPMPRTGRTTLPLDALEATIKALAQFDAGDCLHQEAKDQYNKYKNGEYSDELLMVRLASIISMKSGKSRCMRHVLSRKTVIAIMWTF